ncbi:gamma-glutamyltransferase family protein [Chthonobacter rhizosphaerae]|uniref:gamma-glutamyltransferase family protein n=1 Tax=Chthonobacter rhizosphaerae TaxID=2735553 RepID=UPI0015EEABD7|nr:gamma-glutamyltransferase family protein [Chthonobacter rhizosphaerae]
MLQTPRSRRGMVTSPHHLASQAGLDVLKAGGTAVEAAIATAAALAVVYPHMTHIGGDGFWLIAEKGEAPISIDAAGRAGEAATPDLYRSRGLSAVPLRGPLAANTVAGTVSGWAEALAATAHWQDPMPLEALLEPAAWYAENGMVVTGIQSRLTAEKRPEIGDQPGFADVFLPGGEVPAEGALLKQPAMAETLRRLAREGLDSFYRGPLARTIAADLEAVGSPVTASDLARHQALRVEPLSVAIRGARLFNQRPPTQGLSSLMILALFDRLGVTEGEGFDHIHGLIEATKQAFLIRDGMIGCPSVMTVDPAAFLTDGALAMRATRIDRARAARWPHDAAPGDTIWLGVIDGEGRAVSFIQSIYFEFGSGCVLPETGIVWQNRGSAFALAGDGPRVLAPGRQPFHTLNPAMALFDDGRHMVYGTMGGEGQPQTQSALFSRYAMFGMPLQEALTAPRWRLGKTWGDDMTNLVLENRFDPALVEALRAAGHDLALMGPFDSALGHAGAIVRHADGTFEGATDPRSDGAVAAW